jgi:hypothetical protein
MPLLMENELLHPSRKEMVHKNMRALALGLGLTKLSKFWCNEFS